MMLQFAVIHLLFSVVAGGELARFTERQMTPGLNYRTNVCDRSEALNNGTVALADALVGLELSTLVGAESGLFLYDQETGINNVYPGLMAVLLDEVARRAGFTWRNSFAVAENPTNNETWADLLVWAVNTYDINANWWVISYERMSKGAAFMGEWYDTSMVLIRRATPDEVVSNEINFLNWMKPYEPKVWLMTIVTIWISAFVYLWLEWLQGERNNRSLWEWWCENCYLSFLNSTQAYEYQPTTLAGRTFGVSMAVWALVMTATYTANLASLLVERTQPTLMANNVEQAVVFGFRICVWEGGYSDLFLQKSYPNFKRVARNGEEEIYKALNAGECDYALNYLTSWNKRKRQRTFNPTCALEKVPDYTIPEPGGAFTTKVDSGQYCSSLIRDVVFLHFEAMRADGFLESAWNKEFQQTQDINCDLYAPGMAIAPAFEDPSTTPPVADKDPENRRQVRRQLSSSTMSKGNSSPYRHHRLLKSGGAGTPAEAASDTEHQLTLEQMIGTFLCHFIAMGVSILIAYFNVYYSKYIQKKGKDKVTTASSCNSASVVNTRASSTHYLSAAALEEAAQEEGHGRINVSEELVKIRRMQESFQEQIQSQQQTILAMMQQHHNLLEQLGMERRQTTLSSDIQEWDGSPELASFHTLAST